MAELALRTRTGERSGTVAVADDVFAIQPNVAVLHQVITAQLAARRAGTQSTKTRAEVRGGGKKPYKQKGTGNARQGSTRSPQFEGGGVALGPKPRSYRQRTPKKMVRLALRSALSDRAGQDRVLVVDDWGFDAPSTKGAVAALRALGLDGSVLVVVARGDEATIKSFRNVPEVQLILASELNAYDVLANRWIVFTRSTLPTGADGANESSATAGSSARSGSGASSGSATAEPSAYAEDAAATQQELGASSQAEDALLDDDASTYAHEAAVVADETGEQA